jgi:hypothetical protein
VACVNFFLRIVLRPVNAGDILQGQVHVLAAHVRARRQGGRRLLTFARNGHVICKRSSNFPSLYHLSHSYSADSTWHGLESPTSLTDSLAIPAWEQSAARDYGNQENPHGYSDSAPGAGNIFGHLGKHCTLHSIYRDR